MNDALQRALSTACFRGDFAAATAAIERGASVNVEGRTGNGVLSTALTPLAAAVLVRHRALVLRLLSLGANPNGPLVVRYASSSCADILQLIHIR